MNLRDEDLRAAYRATTVPPGAHPDSEALVRAAEGAAAVAESRSAAADACPT